MRIDEPITDGRRLRGARSRAAVLDQAVDIASLDGLEALSFARVAPAAGLSKAGVQGLFTTKENLQLATLEHARERFVETVITPSRSSRAGLPRLRALVKRWIAYADEPLFAGGCYRAANMATYDGKTGPVPEALARDQRDWRATLVAEIRKAIEAGDIAKLDADQAAFEIDAVLCATNTAIQMGDRKATARARRSVEGILRR